MCVKNTRENKRMRRAIRAHKKATALPPLYVLQDKLGTKAIAYMERKGLLPSQNSNFGKFWVNGAWSDTRWGSGE